MEDPIITLIPNFPCDKEGDGGHGLAVSCMLSRHKLPPFRDGEVGSMLMLMSHIDCQPLYDRVPKAGCVATIDEEVVNGLRTLLAKWAKTAIWPTALRQAVGHPNPILIHKPCKEFGLRRRPSFPNHLVQRRIDETEPLHLIDRFGGIVPNHLVQRRILFEYAAGTFIYVRTVCCTLDQQSPILRIHTFVPPIFRVLVITQTAESDDMNISAHK